MRPVSMPRAASIVSIVNGGTGRSAQQLAFGIVGVGHHAQARDGVVGLARAEQSAGDLGRLAEADRQQAGGERIQAAGVPGLVRAEQMPHPLQRLVGTQPMRLVEQQDAVQFPERAFVAGARGFWLIGALPKDPSAAT